MIACLYEGSAERAILDILHENGFLVFSKEDLLSGDFIRRASGPVFCTRYLGYDFSESIDVIHVQDGKSEVFSVPRPYRRLISSDTRYITSPEIEILIILSLGKYNDFRNSRKKPSEYCKSELRIAEVKTYDFVHAFFADPDKLLRAIKQHKMYYGKSTGAKDILLYDLLSPAARKYADML